MCADARRASHRHVDRASLDHDDGNGSINGSSGTIWSWWFDDARNLAR
jgi:hypothetical protein